MKTDEESELLLLLRYWVLVVIVDAMVPVGLGGMLWMSMQLCVTSRLLLLRFNVRLLALLLKRLRADEKKDMVVKLVIGYFFTSRYLRNGYGYFSFLISSERRV